MVDNLLMIKAEEILNKIEDGKPIEYENIIIFGDLDLHRLDLPLDKNKRKIINSIIKIEYSLMEPSLPKPQNSLIPFSREMPVFQRRNSRVKPASPERISGRRPISPGSNSTMPTLGGPNSTKIST